MARPQKVTTRYKNKGGYEEKLEPEHNASRRELNRNLRDKQSTPGQRASRAVSSAGRTARNVGSAVSGAFGTAFGAIGNFNNKVQKHYKNDPMLHPEKAGRGRRQDPFGGIGSGIGFGDMMGGGMGTLGPYGIEPPHTHAPPGKKTRRRPPMQGGGGFDFVSHMHGTPWDH